LSIEPIGLLTILVGFFCVLLGYLVAAQTLVLATLFGSAAAILIGSVNIQPAHLFLGFVAASTLTRNTELNAAIGAVRFPKPGFWLMSLLIYGVVTGLLMPRLLAGSTPIIPLGSSEYAETGSTVPLGPVSSNYTQALYLVGDFVCFTMIVAIASGQAGFAAITNALLAYAVGNALFAFIDLTTYATGTQWLLGFMRNAQYTLHFEEAVSGLKRIVGSFTEASVFARSTLGVLGFTGTLWICGRSPLFTGTLALVSMVLVILSTSSTGLAGTPIVLIILYVTALMRLGIHLNRPFSAALVLCAPLLVLAAVLLVQLNYEAFGPARDYVDTLIFDKAASTSGIERSSWNTFALQNFIDSYGLGVGLGTVRTSSFPIALLSNVGIPGLLFYLLFAWGAFVQRRGIPRSLPADVRLAARNACLGFIIGDSFAGATVDQGLLFYVLAGIACAEPERGMSDIPVRTP
jgi:hypothetical protein